MRRLKVINKSPAFQFYPDDWMGDINVIPMSPEEEGHYIRLCAICWKQGYLPADPEELQSLLKRPCGNMERILKCFYKNPKENSQLLHKRLEKERKKQRVWRLKCSKGGRKSKKTKPLEPEKKDKGTSTTVVSKSKGYCNTMSLVSNSVSNSVSIKTHTPKERVSWFLEDWDIYPRKEGNKTKAQACYLKTVTTLEKRKAFLEKMNAYAQSVDDPQYLKHGETFFRNWQALVVPKPQGSRSPRVEEQPYIPPPEPKERVRGELELENLWDSALEKIKAEIKPDVFETYFKATFPIKLEEGLLMVAVPNQFSRKAMLDNFRGQIEEILKNLKGSSVLVDFRIQT